MLSSLLLHAVLVAAAPAIEDYIRVLDSGSQQVRLHVAGIVPLRVPERLYYYAEPRPAQPAARQVRLRSEPGVPAPRRAGLRLNPQVELPRLPEPPNVQSVVIQPTPPNAAVLLAPLPALTAWTPRERPVPKAFIMPGRPAEAPAQPALDAPPRLDIPNRETRLSDINLAGLATTDRPALPRPPSRTTPVRVFQPPKPGSAPGAAAIGSQIGEPANLITGGPGGLPPNTYVNIPSLVEKAAAMNVGPPPPKDAAAGSGGSGGGDGKGAGAGGATGSDSGSGASTQGISSGSASAVIELTPGVDRPSPSTRVARVARPKDGRYTFFVMGSSPGEAFPESAGMLSGSLVYTVYLRIGARRDWILQYCLPRSAPQGAVERGSVGKLEAPYAILMLRPEVAFESDDRYAFIHGIIDDSGVFQKLEQVGEAVIREKDYLLSVLRKWEFRPASRDGKPTAVEVLLIIPRQEE